MLSEHADRFHTQAVNRPLKIARFRRAKPLRQTNPILTASTPKRSAAHPEAPFRRAKRLRQTNPFSDPTQTK
jgi:hypothetical protein